MCLKVYEEPTIVFNDFSVTEAIYSIYCAGTKLAALRDHFALKHRQKFMEALSNYWSDT